ncbi:outer membrane beta-barrel protein [Spiribacter sp. 221]|uniref:surface lipoprotein assembly modifier n=1 Tax=Spiribacter onubensis TaxID=3122420 RepID=UPI00349F4220
MSAAGLLAAIQPVGAIQPKPLNPDGPFSVIPSLEVEYGYDDNVNQVAENPAVRARGADGEPVEKETSSVVEVVPVFAVQAGRRDSRFFAAYRPRYVRYLEQRERDQFNHRLQGGGETVINRRNRVQGAFGYSRVEEPLTVTNRRFGEDASIRVDRSVNGEWLFGAEGARGQLQLDLGLTQRRYANNLSPVAAGATDNAGSEYNDYDIGSTLGIRVGGRTRALLSARYSKIDYTLSSSPRGGSEMSVLTGLRWKATGKTTGEIEFGRQRKGYDDPAVATNAVNTWAAEILWEPRGRDEVTLSTTNLLQEGGSGEIAVESQDTTIAWAHEWGARVSSSVALGYQRRDYIARIGTFNAGRTDKLSSVTIGWNYAVRRWMDLGMTWFYRENRSTAAAAEYERNTVLLRLEVSF